MCVRVDRSQRLVPLADVGFPASASSFFGPDVR
jgi:hypothetical protein